MIRALRILVTDDCNYNCIYCHNEGQFQKKTLSMALNDYKKFMIGVFNENISKIWFSGGEPFSNKDVIDMMEWTHHQFPDCRLGCATNASLLTESKVLRLAKLPIKFNVNLPSVNSKHYSEITGGQSFDKVMQNLILMTENNVEYALNFVLKRETSQELESVLRLALERKCGLKILPYTSPTGADTIEDLFSFAVQTVDKFNLNKEYNERGKEITWYNDDKTLRIRTYINPCYDREFSICKAKGEMRVMPDFSVKFCLIGDRTFPIDVNATDIGGEIQKVWMNFMQCSPRTTGRNMRN